MMKRRMVLVSLAWVVVSLCSATPLTAQESIQVQAVIDHLSELVITPQGLYWHNLNHAKPGNYGPGYDTAGPTYINRNEWMPMWAIPGDPRAEDVSDLYVVDTSGFAGFALSSDYDGYFDQYLEYVGGQWIPLGSLLDINRGTLSPSLYDGYPAIRISDPSPGHMVYSFDVVLPEPATLALLAVGALAVVRKRKGASK